MNNRHAPCPDAICPAQTILLTNEFFMNTCPCCSNQMLRHIREHQIRWFCRRCWAEMPSFHSVKSAIVSGAKKVTMVQG